MKRKCCKCNWVSTSMFKKKNRCPKCGGVTEKVIARKLKDVDGFVAKEEIYGEC